MNENREDKSWINDQSQNEKGQSNNPPPPYTEYLKSQQGYNTQDSNVHQYTKENTQPGDKNTYVHGNQQTSVQVTEPYIDIVLNEPVKRPNLVRWSIVTCLFCFWPAGIYGICFAVDANLAADRGDVELTRQKTNTAKLMMVLSVVLGIVTIVTIVLLCLEL